MNPFNSSTFCWLSVRLCASLLFLLCLSYNLSAQPPEQQFKTLLTYWKNGQYEQAEKSAKEIIALPDQVGYASMKGTAHRLLARINASHTNKSEEIDHLFKSYSFFKKANNLREEAETLRMIGEYYLHMRQEQKAKEYLGESKTIAAPLKDTVLQINLLSNLAQLEWHKNRADSSISLFEEAIVLAKRKKYESGLLINWDRLAFLYWKLNNKTKILACVKEAVHHINKQTSSDTVGIVYSDLGWAFIENNQLDSAEWALQKSLNLIRAGNNRVQEMILYKHLSDLRIKQGRTEEAIHFLQHHAEMQNDIFSNQLLDAVSSADVRFREHEANIKLVEAESRDRLFLIGFIAAVAMLLALTYIVFWLRRKNRIVHKHETDLQAALEKLEQSEKIYRQLFENSLAIIATHDLEGLIINANPAMEKTFKLSKKQLCGSSFQDYLHYEYKGQFSNYLQELQEKHKSEGWMRIVDSNGGQHIMRYQNRLIDFHDGPVVVCFAQDQTEFFQTRAQLNREHKRMMTVMENSPDIFSVLNEDATVAYINRPDFLGTDGTAGKSVLQYRGVDQAAQFYRKLIKVFNTNTSVELQESFNGKHYLTKLVPIKIDERVKEVLSINTDITNQKRSEMELKRAKEEAEESNRLKTIFLGSLSHEVRTPLQGIMGMAELLELPTTSEEKRREFIQIIKRRTNDMQNIIESLLDMASLETGEIKSFPVRTNLCDVLETVYQNSLQDHLLVTKPIKLELEIDIDKNTNVMIDPQHLQQVLTNLLRNSIKFTNEGAITLSCQQREDYYLVQVKDTGIGIAPEKIDQIFKPFRQAHEGLSRSKGGIGLGLSICKKMVQMWEGEIFVESAMGKGSVFSITIPMMQ